MGIRLLTWKLNMVILYHYTSETGYHSIMNTRKILKSGTRASDSKCGIGVYFTDMPPEFGKTKIAEGNYDGSGQSHERKGKVDYFLAFDIPDRQVRCCIQREVGGEPVRIYIIDKRDYDWGTTPDTAPIRSGQAAVNAFMGIQEAAIDILDIFMV